MTYEADFYTWAHAQAALLRAGQLDQIDLLNIAEELESMGKSQYRALDSRLSILLMHLLKWEHQPERRSRSWQATIKVQRSALKKHLRENPGLKSRIDEAIADAYPDAVNLAIAETSLPEATFPETCPWSFHQAADETFWPD
jgi:hypothetical protein